MNCHCTILKNVNNQISLKTEINNTTNNVCSIKKNLFTSNTSVMTNATVCILK